MDKFFDELGKFKKIVLAGESPQREVIEGKGFFISYAVAGSGPTGDQTALVKDGNYYILDGDWRQAYRPLVSQGYDACKALFDDKKGEHINFWSDDYEEEEL